MDELQQGDAYVYSAQPRSVAPARRKKYRDPSDGESRFVTNIMHDPRVYRGPTRGVPVPVNASGSGVHSPSASSKSLATRRFRGSSHASGGRVGYAGEKPYLMTAAEIHDTIQLAPKAHVDVPLHLYLEEQVDESNLKTSSSEATQTDAFLPAKPERQYVPPKSGVDAETQVETSLVFDFDRDVEPLLDVMIGKTLEQALTEVRQEVEMNGIVARRGELRERHQDRQREARRLEQIERAKADEQRAALAQARVEAAREKRLLKRLAARQVTKHLIEDLTQRVIRKLDAEGYFPDPTRVAIEEQFMPALYNDVASELQARSQARRHVDGLLQSAVDDVRRRQREVDERHASAIEARLREERERRMTIKLFVHTQIAGDKPVGPLFLKASACVSDVEAAVSKWLLTNMQDVPSLKHISFSLADGTELAKSEVLYDVGVANLQSLEMHIQTERPGSDDEHDDSEDEDD